MNDDDAIAAGLVDVARRAVEHRQDALPDPHGDPLAAEVPTAEASKTPPQRPVEALDEGPEGDDRGGIGSRPALTITEAAEAAGVDRRTIRRRLDNGDLPHAWREDGGAGAWRIPVHDLLAAGLRLHAPTPATPPPGAPHDTARGQVTPPPAPAPDPDELAQWRERALVAEALAAERERTITGLELALRALGPGPPVANTTTTASAEAPTSPAGPAPTPAPSQPATSARSSWWRRLMGTLNPEMDPPDSYGRSKRR